MPNYAHEHDLAKCNVYRCGMNHFPPTHAENYEDAMRHLCGEWDCGSDSYPECDGPVLMVDAGPLHKWEPGSEPPDGDYYVHVRIKKAYTLNGKQEIRLVLSDGRVWSRSRLSDFMHAGGVLFGPIPEQEGD